MPLKAPYQKINAPGIVLTLPSNPVFDAESNGALRLVGRAMFGGAFLW